MKMPAALICEEIQKNGAIPFCRFMALALYCPETGYYESQKDNVGRGGDFITSVSVGPLFGELLGFQFAEWLDELRRAEGGRRIIEAGAHDGKLAADILGWLQQNRPELFERIEYWILEPSGNRQAWQTETLKNFAPRVRWFADIQSLPGLDRPGAGQRRWTGILFSNELLDAFPVRRLGWDAAGKNWFEWGVTLAGGNFIWTRISTPPAALAWPASSRHLPAPLLEVLPDGYTIEISPAAANWWREAAGMLGRGKLMAIDYGFTAEEMISPGRTRGTLRAYRQHHVSDDLLADPGEQDLTAHVNFSAIQQVGEAAGLVTENYSSQTKFLTRILAKSQADPSFGAWTTSRTRQFQTLTHPEHLGRAFRVLVQSR